MSKINLAIIFGGNSSEHNVSRVSAEAVIENLSKDKYNLFTIGITKSGEWYLYQGNTKSISDGTWEKSKSNKKVIISPDKSCHGIIVFDDKSYKEVKLDAVFPVLHGKNGEDGTMQGLLQLSGIPFVGCDTCSSAACMDKIITCIMLESNNVKIPDFSWFIYDDFKFDADKIINKIENKIKSYPMFVKPANSGSSVGVNKVYNKNDLIKAIEIAKNEDKKIIVQKAISGHEVECAVMGNSEPIASIAGEIIPGNDFYDYNAKYIDNTSKLNIPANLSNSIMKEIRETAIKSYKIMGCSGLSRVDFLVDDKTNDVFLNEINTLPGFTSISMYPKLMEESGIKFNDLIDKLINFAIEKHTKQQ